MESRDREAVRAELASKLGREATDQLLDMAGLGATGQVAPIAGKYRLALIDTEAALPECPFIREAKALEQRFREEADQGSMQETHAVYDRLKMAGCRCDGWSYACKAIVEAHFAKLVDVVS